VGRHRDFKFGVRIIATTRLQQTVHERGVVTSCFTPPKISLEQLKLQTSYFVHWLATWSIILRVDK